MNPSETDQNLAGFIAHLHEVEQLSKSTIALTIAGIRFAHRLQNKEIYGTESQIIMHGIQCTGRKGHGAFTGINVDIVKSARTRLGKSDSLKDVRDGLLVGLVSDGLLRGSELLALRVCDIEQVNDGSGRCTIQRSKTDQEGKGSVVFLSPDTMTVFTKYIEKSKLSRDNVLIQSITRHESLSGCAMSRRGLNKLVKSLWERLFGDCEGITSHSFKLERHSP